MTEDAQKQYTLPHTITLKEPIVGLTEEAVKSITFTRKPKVKDLEGIPDTLPNVDRSVKILSRVTGIVSAVISEMDPNDFQEANMVLAYFLPKSQGTGTN
jgi:hypothetical protein